MNTKPKCKRNSRGELETEFQIDEDGNKIYNLGKYGEHAAQDIAWWYMNDGEWPPRQVVHIDGDKMNNAWTNLKLIDV